MSFGDVTAKVYEIITYPVFSINQSPISLSSIILFLLIIFFFSFISRILKNRFLGKVLSRFNLDEGLQFNLIRVTQYIILFIGFVVAFQFVGIDLSALTVVLGFLSVGIGFGLQNITSNFIAGLILLFERPIKVGDRVTVGDTEGDVVDIHIRSTIIRSLNNISIIVPNSEFISNNVINWSHGDKKVRIDLQVGVSYSSKLETVVKALTEVAEENKDVLKNPKPSVQLTEFGDSSWNMVLRVWINDPKKFYIVRSDLNMAIVPKFRKYKVEIPFPQTDLHVRSSIEIPISN